MLTSIEEIRNTFPEQRLARLLGLKPETDVNESENYFHKILTGLGVEKVWNLPINFYWDDKNKRLINNPYQDVITGVTKEHLSLLLYGVIGYNEYNMCIDKLLPFGKMCTETLTGEITVGASIEKMLNHMVATLSDLEPTLSIEKPDDVTTVYNFRIINPHGVNGEQFNDRASRVAYGRKHDLSIELKIAYDKRTDNITSFVENTTNMRMKRSYTYASPEERCWVKLFNELTVITKHNYCYTEHDMLDYDF